MLASSVLQIVAQTRLIVKRLVALADDSPLPLQFAKAEGDLTRVQLALHSVPELERRAVAAIAVIRATPIVPPSIVNVVARISAELQAFRRAAR